MGTPGPRFPPRQAPPGRARFPGVHGRIFWWLFTQLAGDAPPALATLRWGYLFGLLLLVLPLESLTSAARIWLICRVLHPGVSFWVCLQSEFANVAVALLTPSQSGGGPGQIYLLRRSGVSVGTGLTATLLSFMGTLVGLLLLGVYSLAASGIAANESAPPARRSGRSPSSRRCCSSAPRGPTSAARDWRRPRAVWRALGRRELIATGGHLGRRRAARGRPDGRPDGAPRRPALHVSRRRAGASCATARQRRGGRPAQRGLPARAGGDALSLRALPRRGGRDPPADRRGPDGPHLPGLLRADARGRGHRRGRLADDHGRHRPAALAPYYNLLWRFSTAYLAALAGFVCLGRALVQDASRVTHAQPEPR